MLNEIQDYESNGKPEVGELVPQVHGGSIKAGSEPGGNGGKGAVPSEVRAACTEAFAEAIPKLSEIVDWCFDEFERIRNRGKTEGFSWKMSKVPNDKEVEFLNAVQAVGDIEVEDAECSITDIPPVVLREARGSIDAFGKYGLGQKIIYELDQPEWITFAWESAKKAGCTNMQVFTKDLREKMGVPEQN